MKKKECRELIEKIERIFKGNKIPEYNSINALRTTFLIVDPSVEESQVQLISLQKTGKNASAGIFIHMIGGRSGLGKKLALAKKCRDILGDEKIASEIIEYGHRVLIFIPFPS